MTTVAPPVTPDTSADAAAPTRSGPPRAFERHYSKWGLLGALLFFSLSLVPSLLPRSGVAQGLVSGITAVIGYGFATAFVALWHYVGGPVPHGEARRWTLRVITGLLTIVLAASVWNFVGWQNDTRQIFGMD